MLLVEEEGPAGEAAEQQDEDAPLEYDPHAPQVPASKGLGKTMFQRTWGPRPPTSTAALTAMFPAALPKGPGRRKVMGRCRGQLPGPRQPTATVALYVL